VQIESQRNRKEKSTYDNDGTRRTVGAGICFCKTCSRGDGSSYTGIPEICARIFSAADFKAHHRQGLHAAQRRHMALRAVLFVRRSHILHMRVYCHELHARIADNDHTCIRARGIGAFGKRHLRQTAEQNNDIIHVYMHHWCYTCNRS